ncbi:ATP-binding protein [Maribacter chungangensis]|uniref:histidine kinase n=1 Tax=Maribacter chungangensis TaxID=1069117 RepID=A0ABW3B4W5_9FLAO
MVKPSKIFIVLLILAVALLAFIGSSSYKQIQKLRESSEMVAQTLRLETEINRLFSHYAMMQSTVFENKLGRTTLKKSRLQMHKDSVSKILERVRLLTANKKEQLQNVEKVVSVQEEFYFNIGQYTAKGTSTEEQNLHLDMMVSKMAELDTIKSAMLAFEENLLKERKAEYQESRYFTPLMTLLLGMFALSIFLFTFLRINAERKRTKASNAFVQNVLKSTSNVVSHFEPVIDDENNIIDFKFLYTNEHVETVTGNSQNSVIGSNLTDTYPIVRDNGLLELMKKCLQTGKTQQHEYEYEFNGKKIWLVNTVNKLGNGVTNTARDNTKEKNAEEKLKSLNQRLEQQNILLLDGRAFLNNIFKSTSNIVMNLASVRNAKHEIVDFEILFMNDAINDITGDIPEEIKNKKASDIFPTIFTSGVFEKLTTCINEDKQVSYETAYDKDGETLWFQATAIKLNDGVTVTTREITADKRKARELISLNEELEIQNSILSEAERLAKVGSYHWDLTTQRSELSDNFYRILECEPQEFKASFENFKSFIHPDDLEEYIQQGKVSIKEKKPRTYTYRIITKNNKIKHLRTTGHFEERDGKEIIVGVVQDVTQEIKADQRLRNKNIDLQRSNAELESFNRVASHDLQEPMRKIQMFISRISDKELDQLSEKGKTYFEKINSSANRMQSLIKYLLAYSRINKTKKDFVPVSLNETVDKVLEDLEERIQESNVEITVDTLPTLKAVPFQMEQLFNNLISNAIKYRGTAEKSKIIIDCKKIPRSKITDNFNKKRKNYYRLSVIDNGIGFDQENAEQIFGLFERLHQRNEYSGTGIGLAICKKIAENHSGHIVAESEKGKGSTFCVYLPA